MGVYWDTSCVLKLYCKESDSPEYLDRLDVINGPVVSSVLLEAELIFAFYHKELRGEIKNGAADLLANSFRKDRKMARFHLVPFREDIRFEACEIARTCHHATPGVLLRTLDGLHLATAKLIGCREILTTDKRMGAAAAVLGLKVAT